MTDIRTNATIGATAIKTVMEAETVIGIANDAIEAGTDHVEKMETRN